MPSKTPKQARFMAAVAHGWKPTQKGIKAPPLKVAREFNKADKGTKRLSQGMKKRKKYQTGGLARMARSLYAQKPNPRRGMQPQGRNAMVNRAMQRPPPRGGLSSATKPQRSTGLQYDSRRSGPKLQPGAVRGRMPDARGDRGNRPRFGALSRYTGADRSSGPASRRQQPGAGRTRFAGRIPGAQPGNALLRTAGNASGYAGNRLNSLMSRVGRRPFAGGGKVKKAVDALHEARDWLIHSSDEPEFDLALEELDKIGPEADILKTRVKTIKDLWPSLTTVDEVQGTALELDDMFEKFRQAIDDPDAPSFQEQDLAQTGELNTPKPRKDVTHQKIRALLEDYTEGNLDEMTVLTEDSQVGFYQVEVKDLDGNSEIFEIDYQNREAPVTLLEESSMGEGAPDTRMDIELLGEAGGYQQPTDFNAAMRKLQELKDAGKRGTPEYDQALKAAQDLNPNPRTPVGFYLD